MKKTIAAIVCLVMVAVSATTLQAAEKKSAKTPDQNPSSIVYEVNIHMAKDVAICETYLIKVLDENGLLVASPQIYVPGVASYTFQEKSSNDVNGVRIAVLKKQSSKGPSSCNIHMWANPDVEYGPFMVGSVYQFDLSPSTGQIPH